MFDSGEIASKSKIPVKWTAPEALKHHVRGWERGIGWEEVGGRGLGKYTWK